MKVLVKLLQEQRRDVNMLNAGLETLLTIMVADHVTRNDLTPDEEASIQACAQRNTGRFLEDSGNVAALMSLLEENDFYVRHPTVQLLTHLLAQRTKQLQECVLQNPTGIATMIDTLQDTREVIRNGTCHR